LIHISKKKNIGEELILEIYYVGEKLIPFLFFIHLWAVLQLEGVFQGPAQLAHHLTTGAIHSQHLVL
jgi:hypothetical protein